MNPFAHFALGAKPITAADIEDGSSTATGVTVTSPSPCRKRGIEQSESSISDNKSTTSRKKKTTSANKPNNKSSPEIMTAYWIELKNLTTNYPFAVLLTGVLGAQTRDIVTVGVMRQLATYLDGDICPSKICPKSFDDLESVIKRLNYCHKKTQSMMNLAVIFRNEPVPSTMHGLKTIPGVGPVISEIILRVAFGVNVESSDSHSDVIVNDKVDICHVEKCNEIINEVPTGEMMNVKRETDAVVVHDVLESGEEYIGDVEVI